MTNFTKSVVYSGVVLVAGLIAIFAIQNNMNGSADRFSAVEPAAGVEDAIEMQIENMQINIKDEQKVSEEAQEEAAAIIQDAPEQASETADAGVMDAGETILNAVEPAAGNQDAPLSE